MGFIIFCFFVFLAFRLSFFLIDTEKRKQAKEAYEQHEEQIHYGQNRFLHDDPARVRDYLDAKALFMVSDLYTPDELSKQRRRLMKGFHSDSETGLSDDYAKRINKAYDILSSRITDMDNN